MTTADHALALEILVNRCGRLSKVQLESGAQCLVYDVAWGYDMGEEVAHITTNISPGPGTPCEVDFFHATEIVQIRDGIDGQIVFETARQAS
jgi:hypothetical protein